MGPFARVFLGSIFTYQVIYWTWLKLEMDEAKVEKNRMLLFNPRRTFMTGRCANFVEEVAALETTARDLTNESK